MPDDRAHLLELVRRHGRNLHSFMVLEPGLSLWFDEGREAAVAYASRGGHWVAAGSPLCDAGRAADVSRAFAAAARAAGKRAVFFGVSERFVARLDDTFDALQVGLQPSWSPASWPAVVKRAEKLRNRLRRAEKLGVKVRRVDAGDVAEGAPLRAQMAEMVEQWARSRALPPMGFMVTMELFQHAEQRRYFVAESEGVVVGFAVAVPIFGLDGWLIEDMVVQRHAPAGTSEALVDFAMRALADAKLVSLGMVALAGLDAPARPRHAVLTALLRAAARFMGWLYGFEGLYRFRAKMKPERWEPVYIVAPGGISWLTLRAVLMAFAEGWVPRFAMRTVGRVLRRRRA